MCIDTFASVWIMEANNETKSTQAAKNTFDLMKKKQKNEQTQQELLWNNKREKKTPRKQHNKILKIWIMYVFCKVDAAMPCLLH